MKNLPLFLKRRKTSLEKFVEEFGPLELTALVAKLAELGFDVSDETLLKQLEEYVGKQKLVETTELKHVSEVTEPSVEEATTPEVPTTIEPVERPAKANKEPKKNKTIKVEHD